MGGVYHDHLDELKMKDNDLFEQNANEVFRALYQIGIKDWGVREKVAKMMCEAYYAEFDEAIEFAESLGLEKQHIWCYMNTEESIAKYEKYLNNLDESYAT